VLEVLVKLTGAWGGALGVVRDDLDDLDLVTRGPLNEKVQGLLARRAVQEELVALWKEGPSVVDGVAFARRPKVAPDLADQFANTVLLPAMQSDRVVGWLLLSGTGLRRDIRRKEERDFWFTLSSIALTAIQNGVLYKLATVDSLTTLFVRHFFDIEIEKTFGRASRYQENLALLMTDIDHFKRFNDTYGHQLGDRVLRMVAAEMKRCVRLSDVACRYGGEEFAVILPATDVEGARLLAERIRTRIGEIRIPYQGGTLEVTCSVGVSCMSLSGARTTKQFIEEADAALYEAKKGGRNRVCVHKGSRADAATS
jgi:diguanylate cyclase (GGDEF)-like protein